MKDMDRISKSGKFDINRSLKFMSAISSDNS